jgi:hypothetical protein
MATFTYKDKVKLEHLRDENGSVLPQEITFRISPRSLDVEIDTLASLLPYFDEEEDKRVIRETRDNLVAIREEADTFSCYFIPITEGEWSKYVQEKYTREKIVCLHLCDEKRNPVFTIEEIERVKKSRIFTNAAYEAILEASEIMIDASERVSIERNKMLTILKKSREKKQSQADRQAQKGDTSSPADSTSPLGSIRDSFGSSGTSW